MAVARPALQPSVTPSLEQLPLSTTSGVSCLTLRTIWAVWWPAASKWVALTRSARIYSQAMRTWGATMLG